MVGTGLLFQQGIRFQHVGKAISNVRSKDRFCVLMFVLRLICILLLFPAAFHLTKEVFSLSSTGSLQMNNNLPPFLRTPQDRTIAHHLLPGREPYIVFLCGFCSTMKGTKAIQLENWAREKGQGFLRLDYSGHGESSGCFEEGCVGEWTDDVVAVLTAKLRSDSILLVGSSMGSWISFLVASLNIIKVSGIMGIASAPDFTEDHLLAQMTDDQKDQLFSSGSVDIPSSYSSTPYTISRKLIEDGRRHLLLRDPLRLPNMPIFLLHGTDDVDIDPSASMRLSDHLQRNSNTNVRLTLIPHADHRCSSPACLALIKRQLEEMLLQPEDI